MKTFKFLLICLATAAPCAFIFSYLIPTKKQEFRMVQNITSITALKNLFPKTVDAIKALTSTAINQATGDIEKILAIHVQQRTFANTVQAYDTALTQFKEASNMLEVLTMVSPEDALRTAAEEQSVVLKKSEIDLFTHNKKLYCALHDYKLNNASYENLTPKELYVLDNILKAYKKNGLDLPDDKRQKAVALEKEIAELATEFSKNIATDSSSIHVNKEELAGLDENFITSLSKTAEGLYILGVDYPTYFTVLAFADNSNTRKKIYEAFANRAYPKNVTVLETLIEKRHQLAELLGFPSFAHFALNNEMVQTPERAEKFLNDVLEKVQIKEAQEFKQLLSDLPDSIKLSPDGKIYPWDKSYLIEQYKKKHFNIDEDKLAHYFPMEKTIQELLAIYQQFLNIEIKEEPINGLWHPDVKLVTIHQNNKFCGYLLLDLFPRPNKFSHACQITIIPALESNNNLTPAIGVVIANFPQATATQPSLLKRNDVKTFFHEFGHALHALLGATQFGITSGTSVKTDFVEMPSQMLEEWLWDPAILKQVSSHYQTGKPLSDETIKTLINLKNLTIGYDLQRQISYGLLSLNYFKAGAKKDADAIHKNIMQTIRCNEVFSEETHSYCSFGHLTEYDAKYYSYLWSKVFALALFDHIKTFGLLNPEIGTQYKNKILAQGGSKDPNELLYDFLGHAPTQDAFIRDLGL